MTNIRFANVVNIIKFSSALTFDVFITIHGVEPEFFISCLVGSRGLSLLLHQDG